MVAFLAFLIVFGVLVMKDGNEKLYDYQQRSDDAAIKCTDPSRTSQADLEDSDINTIIRRFNVTGEVPYSGVPPQYIDYDGVFDFQSAQNALIKARDDFMAMPARTRARFDNDPQAFLEFCSDPNNLDEMRELGLAIPKEVSDNAGPATDVAKSGG